MFAWVAHYIEKHPSLHRASLSLWRLFPPRLAGFLKGQLARNWLVGAVAVLIDDTIRPPQVLIVEHSYRRKGVWGLPGGALESIDGNPTSPGHIASPDDVIDATLRREVKEELGIEIEVIRLLRVDAIPYIVEEPGPYRLDFYYLCQPVQGFSVLREELASGKVKPASPEIKHMRLVALTDLAGYDLFSPDIRFLKDDLPRLEPKLRDDSSP
ncbi:MAG: NUDIX hydrolase [Gammaproteobacteria bacterium]|nr:NUDIX hydrolase [Gammaproteobacteria bacterium]